MRVSVCLCKKLRQIEENIVKRTKKGEDQAKRKECRRIKKIKAKNPFAA